MGGCGRVGIEVAGESGNNKRPIPSVVLDSVQVIEKMERETGFEPATSSLGSWHSTTELLPRSAKWASYLIPRDLGPARLAKVSTFLILLVLIRKRTPKFAPRHMLTHM